MKNVLHDSGNLDHPNCGLKPTNDIVKRTLHLQKKSKSKFLSKFDDILIEQSLSTSGAGRHTVGLQAGAPVPGLYIT